MTDNPKNYSVRQRIGLFAGPFIFVLILLLPSPPGMTQEAHRTGAAASLMAIWWLSEAISISATALLPLVLFPLLGILDVRDTAVSYGDHNIYLFFGGFLLAAAMEKSKVHLRIAYGIITVIGKNPRSIILGFMVATAFLSMWISNTATTLMMLPIGIASIIAMEEIGGFDDKMLRQFGVAMMLGIAYSASIGGIGTPIGTPPNIIFFGSAETLYPDLPEVDFLEWLILALPVTLILLPFTWLILTRLFFKISGSAMKNAREVLVEKRKSLGPLRKDEKKVLVVFILTAAAWIFRRDIELGSLTISGWSGLFPNPEFISDATVAIAAAVVLFITPVDRHFKDFLLTWDEARNIPWGILILFGGGIALASGFTSSGLSEWLGNNLTMLKGLPVWMFIFIISLLVTFLTEITSNTATTSLFMPLMAGLAQGVGFHPYLLMLPAALSASCAFMLPVATPPNAIVFGSGRISMMQMAKTGFIINILGAVVITVAIYFIASPLLGL